MTEAPLIVGVSGLRGIVGKSLTPEVAVRFAGAFGTWLTSRTEFNPDVLVCQDGREGGDMFMHAVTAALQGVGCSVHLSGTLPTPSAGIAAADNQCDAAIIITASHNPSEWNGLKVVLCEDGSANAPSAHLAAQIADAFRKGEIRYSDTPGTVFASKHDSIVHEIRVKLRPRFHHMSIGCKPGPIARVVLDSVNASGAGVSEDLLRSIGVDHVVQLHGDGSGVFPHPPEPTAENLSGEGGLCDAVPGLKADIGFAQDPDADRLAIVDENGTYIGEEYTLALCAEALLSAPNDPTEEHPTEEPASNESPPQRGPSASEGSHTDLPPQGSPPTPVIVVNLSTSRMVEDVAAKHGAEVIRTPVGEANVVERMKKLKEEGRNVVLGGEGNGGVIWPEVVYIRDSLSAMALVLSLMTRTGKTVSQLVEQINSYAPGGKGYGIVKRKADIPSKDAANPAVEAVAEHFASERIDTQDGVRVDFDPAGPRAGTWIHVRASNTEPIMRLICEAPNKEIATAVLGEVEKVIAG